MKKIFSIILVVATMFAMAMPVFAATDTTKMEQVILSVKERIDNTDEYAEFQSFENLSADKTVSYSLRWTDPEKDYRTIRVNVNQSGVITTYVKNESRKDDFSPKIRDINRKDALKKAEELVKKLNPEIADNLKIYDTNSTNSLWDNGYSFDIVRIHDGILVPENSGHITLDENANEIVNFSITYNENAEFDLSETIISKEDAQKIFEENLGLSMEYAAKLQDDKMTVYPVYKFKDGESKISALDGSVIKPVKWTEIYKESLRTENSAADSASGKLSDAEIVAIEEIQGLISKEEGIKIILGNKYIPTDDTFALDSFRIYQENYDGKYIGTFFLVSEESGESTTVRMNLKTGEILSFYAYRDADVNDKAGKDMEEYAKQAVKELAGEKYSEYVLEENDSKDYFNYIRYVNEIPFKNDRIHISVNNKTGLITSYSIGYSDVEFPSLESVLTHDTAVAKLFEQIDYDMVYTKHMDNNKTYFKLVYDFEQNYITMDADSGVIENLNDEKKFEGYTDISGHYAEKIINILANYGIRTEGREFTPDNTITQGDFAKLLGCISGRYGEVVLKTNEKSDFSWLYYEGIYDKEISENEPLDRITAAKLMISAIGAEEYAKIEGIYKTPFKDVTENVGYVAILYGMGVFKGDGNGNFNPGDNVTYAEAAVMLYNYLTR